MLEPAVRRIERHLRRCDLLGTKEDDLDLSGEGDPASNLAYSAVSGQSPPAGPQYSQPISHDRGRSWRAGGAVRPRVGAPGRCRRGACLGPVASERMTLFLGDGDLPHLLPDIRGAEKLAGFYVQKKSIELTPITTLVGR